MDISSLFECLSVVVARQLGEKRKRRTSQLPRLRKRRFRKFDFQTLESKELLAGDTFESIQAEYDAAIAAATSDFATAQAAADNTFQTSAGSVIGTYQVDANASEASFESITNGDEQALDGTETGATDLKNSKDQVAADLEASKEADSLAVEQQQDDAAKADEQSKIDAAEADFAGAKAGYDSTFQQSLTSDQETADTQVAADQAAYDARAASDEAAYDAAVAADLVTFQNADAANQVTYNSEVDAAAATRDNTIGANGYLWDDALAETDPNFVVAEQLATDNYNNAVAGFAAIADQADVDADTTFNNTEASLAVARDQADQQSQNDYNDAIQAANTKCANDDAIVEGNYASALAQDQAEYDNSVQLADTQYATDQQNAYDAEAQTDAGVDGAFIQSAQHAMDTYNQNVADRTTQFNNDKANRGTQLASQLAGEQTTYDDTVSQAAAAQATDDQDATDDYNNSVAGFRQTQSEEDAAAWGVYDNAMQGADQALAAAWDTYNQTIMQLEMDAMQTGVYDQAAADAAEATLNAAQHDFANTDAAQAVTLQAAIGADAVEFENSEEPAYVTWQDALSEDRGTYDLAVAGAAQTASDNAADDQAAYENDISQMTADYNTDIADLQAAVTLQIAALSQTRVMGEEAAAETCTAALAAAAAKDVKAVAAASTVKSNEDVIAYEAEQNGLAADQQQLQKDTADAEMTLGQETSAHNQTFQAGLAAAAVVQEHAWADAQADYELDSAGAAAQYEADVMQAEASTLVALSGNDPTMIAVANAWLQFTVDTNAASMEYEEADVADWLTEQTDDTAAWLADVSDKDAAEAQQEVDDRAAKYTQMIDDAAAGVKDVSDTMTAETPRMSKEAAASETSIGIQADDMVAKVAKDIAATLVETTSLVADALEWWQTVTNAWDGWVAQVEGESVTTNTEIANDIKNAIHGLDAANDAEVQTLVPKAEEADHKAAVAHEVYGPKYVSIEAKMANDAAQQHESNVAGLLDSTFAGLQPGDREAMIQMLGDEPESLIPALWWQYHESYESHGTTFEGYIRDYAETQWQNRNVSHANDSIFDILGRSPAYIPPSQMVQMYELNLWMKRPNQEPEGPNIGVRVLMPGDPLDIPMWGGSQFELFVQAMYARQQMFPWISYATLRNAILSTEGGREFLIEYEEATHAIFIDIRNELSHLREIEEQHRENEEWEKEYMQRANRTRNNIESYGKKAWDRNPKRIPPKGQRPWRK